MSQASTVSHVETGLCVAASLLVVSSVLRKLDTSIEVVITLFISKVSIIAVLTLSLLQRRKTNRAIGEQIWSRR
ncbi:hypothetical protein B0T12DRAFT_204254 [Alternaria alternata]|jgi:hypothetical protein|nr:hypothetical protein B0T12DRAFT_204254 [Alternaria alternata]